MLGRRSLAVFQGEVFEFPPLCNDYRTLSSAIMRQLNLLVLMQAHSSVHSARQFQSANNYIRQILELQYEILWVGGILQEFQ